MSFANLLAWIIGRPGPTGAPAGMADGSSAGVTRPAPGAPPPTAAAPGAPGAAPRERRAAARLDLGAGTVDLEGVGTFPMRNLSFGGVAIETKGHPWFQSAAVGQELPARVTLGAVFLVTALKIRSRTATEIGCSFVHRTAAHARLLDDLLRPRMLGSTLHEVGRSVTKEVEAGVRRRWFQGERNTQLIVWQKPDGSCERAELSFLEYVITWDPGSHDIRTGTVRKTESGPPPPGPIDPNTVVFFKEPSHRALRLARTLLATAGLPEEPHQPFREAIARAERCSFHRVVLGERERNIVFAIDTPAGPRRLTVANLCPTQLAFLVPTDGSGPAFDEGAHLDGSLQLPDMTLRAIVTLVYAHDHVIGGGLRLTDESDRGRLAAYLAPRLLGQSLEPLAPPSEIRRFAPPGARAHLHVGIHNTHLLSLVTPPPYRLVYGRLAFMDRILLFDRGAIRGLAMPRGIVFPADWDLPSDDLDEFPLGDGRLLGAAHQIIDSGSLPEEITVAWRSALPEAPADAQITETGPSPASTPPPTGPASPS